MNHKPQHDKRAKDPRSQARRLALQFLHCLDAQKGQCLDLLDDFLAEQSTNPTAIELARNWVRNAWRNVARLDLIISQAAHNRKLDAVSVIDLSNLRLAVYQLTDCEEIPAKVVINEAVELAKEFSSDRASTFINGVLDAVCRNLKTSTSSENSE